MKSTRKVAAVSFALISTITALTLGAPDASSYPHCVCPTPNYSVYILADGSSCSSITPELTSDLYAQAEYNCVDVFGRDNICNAQVTLQSCYFANGQYHQAGTITYRCQTCFDAFPQPQ